MVHQSSSLRLVKMVLLITCLRDLERRKETLPTLPDLPDSHAETELLGELESTCNELCTYVNSAV